MNERIPLDSGLWDVPKWFPGDGEPFNTTLERLVNSDRVDSGELAELIDAVWETDYPAPQFYYMIPWLLDIFERSEEYLMDPISAFCHCLFRCYDGKPSQTCLEQLETNKHRIVPVLLRAMEESSGIGFDDRANFKYYVGGIAAMYGAPQLGEQISGLEPLC